jgi:glycosyltransferase involved in cell wall biosynthesis
MISILIPIFNRDVNELADTLSRQIEMLGNKAEIIAMDDGSETFYKNRNSKLAGKPFVRYLNSGSNHGRLRTRQMLADAASYKWLLFLDNDSRIFSDHFLANYFQYISDALPVIMGGRIYTPQKPSDCHLALHWLYGSHREVTNFGERSHLINRFMTNNFFIHKSIFQRFDFTGEWNGYGYEDSWMAVQLEAMGVPLIFIDNPVFHDGLETSAVFLEKSREALMNLKALSRVITEDELRKHVKLYDYFCLLKRWRVIWMINIFHLLFEKINVKNLTSCYPSLILFDLYRLGFFSTQVNTKTIPS